MTTRRSNGPRRDEKTGTWWFVTELGAGPDGSRRQARRRGFPTKRAAQEALDKLRVSSAEGVYVAPRRQRLGDFLTDDWLPTQTSRLAASTFESYERNLRTHIIPALGGVQLQQVDAAHLNRRYAEMLGAGGRADGRGGLSPRTVRYVATILHAALDDAVRWGRLVRNPADAADPPPPVSQRRRRCRYGTARRSPTSSI